jgi:hypothetical protein
MLSGLYLLPYTPKGLAVLSGAKGFADSCPKYFPLQGSTILGAAIAYGLVADSDEYGLP